MAWHRVAVASVIGTWAFVSVALAQQAGQAPSSEQPEKRPSSPTAAQQPPAWAQQLLQRIDKLERQLASRQQGQEEKLPDWAQELILRVDRLENQVQALAAQSDEALRAVRDLARREGDRYYPLLLGKMQDPKFRDEVQRVVQGTLVINNLTGVTQPFYINGVLWNVPPGRSELKVPIGTVYARLPWEPDSTSWNNWKMKNGRQELYLEIR